MRERKGGKSEDSKRGWKERGRKGKREEEGKREREKGRKNRRKGEEEGGRKKGKVQIPSIITVKCWLYLVEGLSLSPQQSFTGSQRMCGCKF